MKRIIKLLDNGIQDDGGYKSAEFKSFARLFKNDFQKELNTIDAKIVNFSIGHYYVSGFIKLPNGNLYYFSVDDIRHSQLLYNYRMLYRTAEHEKDYTGGGNQWINIETGMSELMNMR